VGSCRREILDHVIALNEAHLRRLMCDYVNYHHEDRIHDGLSKDTPNRAKAIFESNCNLVGAFGRTASSVQLARGSIKVCREMDTNAAGLRMTTACGM
jgi:hypothetical protein